jgi:hypothetical protein
MSVRRERELQGDGIRLIVEGEWSAAAQHEAAAGGFDVLELQRGRQKDFSFLPAQADRIPALWINCESDSSSGLEQLAGLSKLTLSFPLRKGFDFRRLTGLKHLRIEAWQANYAETLFAHPAIESLHIEGYDGTDCTAFAAMPQLATLSLAKGKLKDLAPLRRSHSLRTLRLSHLRGLTSIEELRHLPDLRQLALGEGLGGVADLSPLFGAVQLETLVIVGTGAQVEQTAWLRKLVHLRDLRLQSGVVLADWGDLLVSPVLGKLAVVLTAPVEDSDDAIRARAKAAGHRVRDFVRFGTRKRPAFLIELEP